MLIEICAGHSVANVSSKYWVSHLFREGEAAGVEWKLSDQLTEHGMSPHCHLTGAGLSSLKCQPPKSQTHCTDTAAGPPATLQITIFLFVYFWAALCTGISQNVEVSVSVSSSFWLWMCEDRVWQMCLHWLVLCSEGGLWKRAGQCAASANRCAFLHTLAPFYRLLTWVL